MTSTKLDPRATTASAERLLQATSTRTPYAAVRNLIGGHDLDTAQFRCAKSAQSA